MCSVINFIFNYLYRLGINSIYYKIRRYIIYLPVFMISFYMLIDALDGFIQPLMYNIYMFAIVLDVIQIISYFTYNQSIIAFTYIILTIQSITFEIARIHTVDFI